MDIEWRYWPLSAPHFGGAHESFVRSTKPVLLRAIDIKGASSNHAKEEVFQTQLYEVARLLNICPLTFVSSDVEDDRAIKPDDLLGRLPTTDTIGRYNDALPVHRYRHVQKLMDLFWDLWVKTY